MGEDFTVRAAVQADLEAVAAICAHYVRTTVTTFEEVPPTAADWRRRLDDLAGRNLPFLVAEADGTVCGFAYASPWRPKPAYRHTVEDTVYISPARTGRGLGRALLGALLSACEQAGPGRSSRSSPIPAATPRSRCTAGSASTHAGRLRRVGRKHGPVDRHRADAAGPGARAGEYPVHRPRGALAGTAGEAEGRGAPGTRGTPADHRADTTARSDHRSWLRSGDTGPRSGAARV